MNKFSLLTILSVITLSFSLLAIDIATAQEVIETEQIGQGETPRIIDPGLVPRMSFSPIQTWPDKKITVIIDIDSKIDSDRVSVDWVNFPASTFLIQGPFQDVVSVRAGQTTRLEKDFIVRPGLLKLNESNKEVYFGIRVNAFVADVNYLSSIEEMQLFNSDYELLPISDQYATSKILSTVANYALVIICIGIIVGIIYIVVKKIRTYVNTPDLET